MVRKVNTNFIVLIGVIFVSFGSIFAKTSNAPSLIIATYRLGFTVLIMLPYVLTKRMNEIKNISKKNMFTCIISGIFLSLHFVTWLTSINYTSIASSTVLVNTHPIFIVIGSIFILKEKVSLKSLISIFIALIGSSIISFGDSSLGSSILFGDFLAIAGAFFMAGYMMIGKVIRQELSTTSYTFIVYSSSTITLIIMDIITQTPFYPYPKQEWLIFLGLAVFCTILGHTIFNWALEYLSPSFVSIAILGEPVFATIWAIFLLKELPSPWQIIGGIIILIGISIFIKVSENSKGAKN